MLPSWAVVNFLLPSRAYREKDEVTDKGPRTAGASDVGGCWASFICPSRPALPLLPPALALGGESLDCVSLAPVGFSYVLQ